MAPSADVQQFKEKLSSLLDLSHSLQVVRKRAFDAFAARELLEDVSGEFSYFPLRSLLAHSTEEKREALLSQEQLEKQLAEEEADIVFVDGAFSSRYSRLSSLPSSVVALPLSEAYLSYKSFIQSRFEKSLKEETDPFAFLHLSLFQEGLFLYIPPKTSLERPLRVVQVVTGGQMYSAPRLHIVLGSCAVATVHATVVALEAAVWNHSWWDITLEEGASLFTHFSSPALEGWNFLSVRANLKKNGRWNSVSTTCGSSADRADYKASLLQEGSEANLYGLWTLDRGKQSHVRVFMDHQAPNCRSMQLFKGVLQPASRSSFEGKIYIHKEAQQTQAYQLNRHLLLGRGAVANSKPHLEIFADDVKASHGATTTQINPDHLFYLKSRGLSEQEAKQLLIEGFCKEILDLIPTFSSHAL